MEFMIITTNGTYLIYKDDFIDAVMYATEQYDDTLVGIICVVAQ